VPHSNRATPGARLCFLFIEPGAAAMPDHCCTLKISPLVRELILTLAERNKGQKNNEAMQRLIQVLFDELPQQPQQQLQLPVSAHPKIRQMVDTMAAEPAVWQTLGQWAERFAMSERNLARLVVKETGLSFRRWRHQLQLIVALRLLIGGQSVQQVAQALGYDSTTAFITMFKKGLGQTPARYVANLASMPR
jgi:AraC-like DNA-binding protein